MGEDVKAMQIKRVEMRWVMSVGQSWIVGNHGSETSA